jgi:hypothetical protein
MCKEETGEECIMHRNMRKRTFQLKNLKGRDHFREGKI